MAMKRGIFFTMIAVFVVGVLVMLSTSYDTYTGVQRIPTIEERVSSANQHLSFVENTYIPLLVRTGAIKSLHALAMYTNYSEQDFLASDDVTRSYLRELLVNGTIDQQPSNFIPTEPANFLMQDANLTFRFRQLENLTFATTRLNLTFNTTSLWDDTLFYQDNSTGPFLVGVNLTLRYRLQAGVADWNRTRTIAVMVPITGLDDPLYFINAIEDGAGYTNRIWETNISQWNVTNLALFVNRSAYRSSEKAPSFLMRYAGNDTNSTCCGIESAINSALLELNELAANDDALQRSFIDWCFFGSRCAPDPVVEGSLGGTYWNVTGVSNYTSGGYNYGFKLDTAAGVRYNVTQWLNHTYCDPAVPC